MMLNSRGHPCFFLNLEGKAFSFSLENVILAFGFGFHFFCLFFCFCQYLFQVEDIPEHFHHEQMLNFVNILFLLQLIKLFFFIRLLILWIILVHF